MSKKSNFNAGNFTDNEALIERVKELECLYDIAALANSNNYSFEKLMKAISHRIGLAWRFSEDAQAEVIVEGKTYFYKPIAENSVKIKELMLVEGEIVGTLAVHYPANKYKLCDFLPEELKLLNKLAQEIAVIIERKKRIENEETLKRMVERNDRLSILGEITAGIAHELNTPLGNILGFSEFILNNSIDKGILADAQKINSSALHAREVVKKLMFFSCEMPQQMKSVALNPLVEDALELLKPAFKTAAITLNFEPEQKTTFARLDPVQFTQVIFNLMINAIYASHKGDTIKIKLATDKKNIRLIIADEGTGIPKEIQHKIFEPFFTTKPTGKGSGLGLSMVHGIVKSHKGNIQFSSEEGNGTTFVVSIPLHV